MKTVVDTRVPAQTVNSQPMSTATIFHSCNAIANNLTEGSEFELLTQVILPLSHPPFHFFPPFPLDFMTDLKGMIDDCVYNNGGVLGCYGHAGVSA